MHAKVEDNLIVCLCFMTVFNKCAKIRKREKKNKENKYCFKAHISGMASAIYFSPDMLAPAL